MKSQNSCRRLLALLLACLLSLACAPETLAADAEAQAQVMQLMRTEGTVTVSNSVKKSLTLLKNMRLYNGYHVATDEASYAWVNLDSEKLLKMDAVSEISVRKNKKKLDVLLDSGNLFFNVTKPLEDDELLTIRTSTMAVGIRGTCGWVEVNDQRTMRVSVLEGTVSCSVTDPVSGQTKTESVSGGQTAVCTVDGKTSGDNANINILALSEADVNGFALVELAGDSEMCDKIFDDSGIDLRGADGNARLKQDEADVHAKLSDINTKIGQQDKTVDTNTLKPTESEKPSTSTTPTTSTSRPSYRPSTPPVTTPTDTVTLSMPQTASAVNEQLAKANVKEVVLTAANSSARTRAGEDENTIKSEGTQNEHHYLAPYRDLKIDGMPSLREITNASHDSNKLSLVQDSTTNELHVVIYTVPSAVAQCYIDSELVDCTVEDNGDGKTSYISFSESFIAAYGYGAHPIWVDYTTDEGYLDRATVWYSAGDVSYSLDGELPNGLTLDSATGEISGIPTEAGVWTFDVVATYGDLDNRTNSQSYMLTVKDESGNIPVEPDTPDTPDTPDVPDTPDTPDTPDVPDTPDTPDVPDEKVNILYVDAPLSIPNGKLLTLGQGVSMVVAEQQSVHVAGTLTVGGAITSYGAIAPVQGAVVKAQKFDLAAEPVNWNVSETTDSNGFYSLDYHEPTPVTYTVTFDANGGTVTPTSARTDANGKLAYLPTPTKDGFAFDGWATGQNGEGVKVDAAFVFTKDTTIYAYWSEKAPDIPSTDFTWDYNRNIWTLYLSGNGKMPDYAPVRDDYPSGAQNTPPWSTDGGEILAVHISSGLTSIGNNTFCNCFMLKEVFYSGTRAQWNTVTIGEGNEPLSKATIHCVDDPVENAFTVTFNANGGTVSPSTATTDENGKLTLTYLPTPNRNGYRFNGWFTEAGLSVTLDTVFTEDTTVIARWIGDAQTSPDYDTLIRKVSANVDRGIGRVNAYLTGGRIGTTMLDEYEGNADGSLYQDRNSDDPNAYRLEPYFYFSNSMFRLPNGTSSQYYGGDSYTGIRIEIVPFAGEHFSGDDLKVLASYYDYDLETTRSLATTATLAEDKIVITSENPVPKQDEYSRGIDFEISLNGKTQTVYVSTPAPSSRNTTEYDWEYRFVDTWAEALTALRETANTSGYLSIVYEGTADVTLSESLNLAENQCLEFRQASLTIPNGITLAIQGNSRNTDPLRINGILTVDKGGYLSADGGDSASSGYRQGVYCYDNDIILNGNVLVSGNAEFWFDTNKGNITMGSGAHTILSKKGDLRLCSNNGTICMESGSQITVSADSSLDFSSYNGSIQIGGTIAGSGDLNFYGKTTVTAGGHITASYLYANKGLTNSGVIETETGYFYFGMNNSGTIRVTGRYLRMHNLGHTITNSGTIQCAGQFYMDGTVLVNTGTIEGSGVFDCRETANETDYDYGIEDVQQDSQDYTPSNYSHKKYVNDPGTKAEITYLIGELRNEGTGSCTLPER